MGRWASPEAEATRAVKGSTVEKIVQLSDYICSRKIASFLPGVELSEKVIRNYLR
ncbi:hypothetical protein GOV06_02595 [Candidatus Woesearchaeota archaeon]|nr:hypothetical protein [Candidatus Woesearchaeota archaeon]